MPQDIEEAKVEFMADEEKKGAEIASVVPQLFYDIIARIIPGSVVIGTIAIAALGPGKTWESTKIWLNKGSESYPPITVILGVTLALSYTLAILLLGCWSLIFSFAEKRGFTSPDDDSRKKYDFIKQKDPTIGNRITKLYAEIHMTEILIIGFTLSFGINLWNWSNPPDSSRSFLLVFLPLLIVGSFGARRHFNSLYHATISNIAELFDFSNTKPRTG